MILVFVIRMLILANLTKLEERLWVPTLIIILYCFSAKSILIQSERLYEAINNKTMRHHLRLIPLVKQLFKLDPFWQVGNGVVQRTCHQRSFAININLLPSLLFGLVRAVFRPDYQLNHNKQRQCSLLTGKVPNNSFSR